MCVARNLSNESVFMLWCSSSVCEFQRASSETSSDYLNPVKLIIPLFGRYAHEGPCNCLIGKTPCSFAHLDVVAPTAKII